MADRFACEQACFPSAEEFRMVRAIALRALQEAARHGAYRASFHGFCVRALRQAVPLGYGVTIEVTLVVTLGKKLFERGVMTMHAPHRECHGVPAIRRAETSNAGDMEPMAGVDVM